MKTQDYYQKKGKEEALDIPEVKEYYNELQIDITRISHLKTGVVQVLIHPIRTIRTKQELKRLKREKAMFDEVLDAPALKFDYGEVPYLEDAFDASVANKIEYAKRLAKELRADRLERSKAHNCL
jgi:hypothetical protein